jgi:hypothetical protein
MPAATAARRAPGWRCRGRRVGGWGVGEEDEAAASPSEEAAAEVEMAGWGGRRARRVVEGARAAGGLRGGWEKVFFRVRES